MSPIASVVILLIVAWATACSGTDHQNTPTAAPPITAQVGTALHYAQVCQQQLGQIPTWACQDGVPIPITVDGKPVTTTPDKCDNPDLKGQCVVGSYAGHVAGMNFDGSPKPEVNWVYFCRRDDNFAQMIGYDKNSGATCFFELKDGFMPLEQGVPKGTVPGVKAPEYESAWKRPESIAVQGCNTCHSPDPFIHTPYIDAARQQDDAMKPVVPKLATPTSPYFVLGEAFAGWTFDYVEFDNNACTDGNGSFVTTYGTLNAADPFAAGTGTFSGTDITSVKVGAVAGAAVGQIGIVQLDILGHQESLNHPQDSTTSRGSSSPSPNLRQARSSTRLP